MWPGRRPWHEPFVLESSNNGRARTYSSAMSKHGAAESRGIGGRVGSLRGRSFWLSDLPGSLASRLASIRQIEPRGSTPLWRSASNSLFLSGRGGLILC